MSKDITVPLLEFFAFHSCQCRIDIFIKNYKLPPKCTSKATFSIVIMDSITMGSRSVFPKHARNLNLGSVDKRKYDRPCCFRFYIFPNNLIK